MSTFLCNLPRMIDLLREEFNRDLLENNIVSYIWLQIVEKNPYFEEKEMKKRSNVLTSCLVIPKPITGPKRMEKLKMMMNQGVPKVILMIIIAMNRLISLSLRTVKIGNFHLEILFSCQLGKAFE